MDDGCLPRDPTLTIQTLLVLTNRKKANPMKLTEHMAKHLRDVHFGGNWTSSNLKDKLADVTWQQATRQIGSFHPIATLVYHMNYFSGALLKVLHGGPLDAKDKYSFNAPPILSQEDWEQLLDKTWTDAEELAGLIEQLPENQLWETFVDEKYGSYYRNIHGLIEHDHYHLGQIALIKTMLLQAESSSS